MVQIAASGSVADALAVDEENKAVVGANADGVSGWNGGKVESAAEVEDDGVAEGSRGVG